MWLGSPDAADSALARTIQFLQTELDSR
jgi:hypothetical protein